MGVIATGVISLEHFNPGERAVALEEPGRLDGAAGYERCLEHDPSYADAYHNLASLLERLECLEPRDDLQAIFKGIMPAFSRSAPGQFKRPLSWLLPVWYLQTGHCASSRRCVCPSPGLMPHQLRNAQETVQR